MPPLPAQVESDEEVLCTLADRLASSHSEVKRQPRLQPHEDEDAHLHTVTDICRRVHSEFFRIYDEVRVCMCVCVRVCACVCVCANVRAFPVLPACD